MAFAAAARAPFFIHWADFKPCTCCSCQESMYHTGMFVLVVKCVSCEAPHHRINTMFPHLRKKCQSPQVNKPISRTKWNSHHQSRSKPLTWPFGSSNLALSPKQLNVKEPCDLWPRKHSLCFMQWKHMKTTTTSNAARQDLLDWDAEFGLRFVKAYMGWTQTQDVFNSGSKRSKDMRNLKSCGILSDSNLPTDLYEVVVWKACVWTGWQGLDVPTRQFRELCSTMNSALANQLTQRCCICLSLHCRSIVCCHMIDKSSFRRCRSDLPAVTTLGNVQWSDHLTPLWNWTIGPETGRRRVSTGALPWPAKSMSLICWCLMYSSPFWDWTSTPWKEKLSSPAKEINGSSTRWASFS